MRPHADQDGQHVTVTDDVKQNRVGGQVLVISEVDPVRLPIRARDGMDQIVERRATRA